MRSSEITLLIFEETLHERSKDEIVGEDVEQHRKTKRIVWAGIITLILLTVISIIAAAVAGKEWIKSEEELGTNYWSRGVSAKKGEDPLRAAHFFAKAAKEFGSISAFASYTSRFGIGKERALEILVGKEKARDIVSQIKALLLNIQVDSHEIFLGQVLTWRTRCRGCVF